MHFYRKAAAAMAVAAVIMTAPCRMPVLASESAEQLNVVTTIFPIYDWVRQIIGETENASVSLLLDDGVDLHSFQPSAKDIIGIDQSDVFIYVGGESDRWVRDILQEAHNEDRIDIALTQVLKEALKEEETVEGMQEEATEESGQEDAEYDEHVWLSLNNAALLCEHIAKALGEADPDNAGLYLENAASYTEELRDLDAKYRETIDHAQLKTLIFADRFPFRYLTDDYGLDYYAAFSGCSAETEASFDTIIFLADKVKELKPGAILTIEGTDHNVARTVKDTAGGEAPGILSLDSMQSVVGADDSKTYLSAMEENLKVLAEALKSDVQP